MEIIEKRGEPVDDTKKKGSLQRDVRTTFEILSLVALIIASLFIPLRETIYTLSVPRVRRLRNLYETTM